MFDPEGTYAQCGLGTHSAGTYCAVNDEVDYFPNHFPTPRLGPTPNGDPGAHGGSGAGSTYSPSLPSNPCNNPNNAAELNFITLHLSDAATVADQLNVSAADILGLSARLNPWMGNGLHLWSTAATTFSVRHALRALTLTVRSRSGAMRTSTGLCLHSPATRPQRNHLPVSTDISSLANLIRPNLPQRYRTRASMELIGTALSLRTLSRLPQPRSAGLLACLIVFTKGEAWCRDAYIPPYGCSL